MLTAPVFLKYGLSPSKWCTSVAHGELRVESMESIHSRAKNMTYHAIPSYLQSLQWWQIVLNYHVIQSYFQLNNSPTWFASTVFPINNSDMTCLTFRQLSVILWHCFTDWWVFCNKDLALMKNCCEQNFRLMLHNMMIHHTTIHKEMN